MSLQKLVKTCPLGATKPLSLIKPPAQGIAISVVPTKVPVSMVTAHLNGQKVATSEPINLQTGSRAVGAGVLPFTRRAPELPPSQVSDVTMARVDLVTPPLWRWVGRVFLTFLHKREKLCSVFRADQSEAREQQISDPPPITCPSQTKSEQNVCLRDTWRKRRRKSRPSGEKGA